MSVYDSENYLEFYQQMDPSVQSGHRLSRIIGTISEATRDVEIMEKMIVAGMNIARLNMSHGTAAAHESTIKMLREANDRCFRKLGYNPHLAIAIDLKGPEIRTGLLEGVDEIMLIRNENIKVSVNPENYDKGSKDCIFVDYPKIVNVTKIFDRIWIHDGAIVLVIREVTVDYVLCQIEVGGLLGSHQNVQLPNSINLELLPISEKDQEDIRFAANHQVQYIFATVLGHNTNVIKHIRTVLGDKGKDIMILINIENMVALKNVTKWITAADGIVFARANVGVELSEEQVVLAQRAVYQRCNRVGKPVVCSTNVLQSMKNQATPKGTEIADVANAIIDGADCVMLTGAISDGKYIIEAIESLAAAIREAEVAQYYRPLVDHLCSFKPAYHDAVHSMVLQSLYISEKCNAAAILVISTSGRSAQLLGIYRPRVPIISVARDFNTARLVQIRRGLIPVMYPIIEEGDWSINLDARIKCGLHTGKKIGFLKEDDTVVVLTPWYDGLGFTNCLHVVHVKYEPPPIIFDERRRSSQKSDAARLSANKSE